MTSREQIYNNCNTCGRKDCSHRWWGSCHRWIDFKKVEK